MRKKWIHIVFDRSGNLFYVLFSKADKIGTATVRLGQYLAPHIQKQGTKLLTTGFNMSEQEASNKMKSILTVAAGAVEGFSTVYRGLETSASILGSSLKENTVKIVEHKWVFIYWTHFVRWKLDFQSQPNNCFCYTQSLKFYKSNFSYDYLF